MNYHTRSATIFGLAFVTLILGSMNAAATGTATNLPWEDPLDTIVDSLTGPVALSLAGIGLFVCGGMLIFGGELSDFTKRSMYAILAVSVMVGGGTVMTTLFSTTASI